MSQSAAAARGPPGLPRKGARGALPHPFDPDSCPRSPLWPTAIRAPWSERRVRGKLEDFLQGRAEWPPWESFHASGRARLHEQVMLPGGAEVWARRVGIAPPPGAVLKRPWTDERIRATLSFYLSDRVRFSTPAEFRADGQAQLREAITAHGGVDRWAHDFGLPPPHRLRGAQTWWTDERIDAELRRFTEGRAVFPAQREFRQANQGAPLAACAGTAGWIAGRCAPTCRDPCVTPDGSRSGKRAPATPVSRVASRGTGGSTALSRGSTGPALRGEATCVPRKASRLTPAAPR